MRGHALAVAILVGAASCSSFEEGHDATPTLDGGVDEAGGVGDTGTGDGDASQPEPLVAEQLRKVGGTILSLCASSRGVAWTRLNSAHAIIDGKEHVPADTDNTQGACILAEALLVYTDVNGIRTVDFAFDVDAAPPENELAGSLDSVGPLATDGVVFFTAENAAVRRILETTDATPKTLGIVNGGAVKAIAANSTLVFVGTGNGELFAADRNGSVNAATKVADVGSTITGLALAGDRLYVATGTAIKSCVQAACASFEDLATGLLGASEVVVSGDDLFWIERDGDRVVTCKRQGCTPRTLTKIDKPIHLALGDRIYVSDTANAIWSVAK